MKEFTFVAYCTFGKGDSGETEVTVELTDEEAERLIKFGTQTDTYYNGFSRCEELRDIYKRIYALAVAQMTEELRDFGDMDREYTSDPNWQVDDLYACGVNFPSEFEYLLPEGEADENEKDF